MSGVTPEDARDDVSYLLEDKPRYGETWYCISQKWWEDFRRFAHLDDKNASTHEHERPHDEDERDAEHAPTLPPLDCSALGAENGKELRRDIVEHRDFAWVHGDVYEKLKGWFGVTDGTPEFPRGVIEVGLMQEARIEMYPPYVKTCSCNDDGTPNLEKTRIWHFSSQDNLKKLVDEARSEGYSEEVRLWRLNAPANDEDGEADVDALAEETDDWDPFGVVAAQAAEDAAAAKRQAEADAAVLAKDRELNGVTEANSGAAATGEDAAEPEADAAAAAEDEPVKDEEDDEENDGWVLCTKDELDTEFEHWAQGVDLVSTAMYMLEQKDGFESWSRKTPAEKWRKELVLQQKLDVFDRQVKRWYKGTVIELEGVDRVKMHYDGYHSKYDEWIDKLASPIIAPLGTHTVVASSSYNRGYSTWSYYRDQEGRPRHRGGVGLRNLGNTCFMNSVVQCMSHSPYLVEYFARGEYRRDINRDNPLGWGGRVAEAWGDHIKKYWSQKYKVLAPSSLKRTIAEVQPRFSGYNQHDSSELLQFLLDGLHEDLNRIKDKPYTNTVESNGRADAEVAGESWQTHKLRNDSVIVDRVQGQLKSRVQCPDCERVSVTFDPYMFLSVPLPTEQETTVRCVIIPYPKTTPGRPKLYRVTAPKIGSIGDLKDAVAEASGVIADRLVVADIWQKSIYKIYMNYEQLGEIRENDDVYIFEVPSEEEMKVEFPEAERFMLVPVVHRQWRKSTYTYYSNSFTYSETGIPLVVRLPIGDAVDPLKVDEIVRNMMSQYVDESVYDLAAAQAANPQESSNNNAGSSNNNAPGMSRNPLGGSKPVRDEDPDGLNAIGGLFDSDDEAPANNATSLDDDEAPVNNNANADGDADAVAANANANGVDEKYDDEKGGDQDEDENYLPPFTIVHLDRSARRCGTCMWSQRCDGCRLTVIGGGMKISDDAYDSCNIGIDWEIGAEKCFDHDAFEHPEKDASFHDNANDDADDWDADVEHVPLSDTLNEFTKEEVLSKTDAWYCRNCGEHKQASKKFDIWSIPDICIIHLKRFQQNGYYRDKDETPVDYPVDGLDLSPWVVNPDETGTLLDLVGISVHMGNLGGGHYIAFLRNLIDGQWYEFDDTHVQGLSDHEIQTKNAYVLFYKKRAPGEGPPAALDRSNEERRDTIENAPPLDPPPSYNNAVESGYQALGDDEDGL